MKKKCTKMKAADERTAVQSTGGNEAATARVKGQARDDRPRDTRKAYPEGKGPNRDAVTDSTLPPGPDGAGQGIDACADAVLSGTAAGAAAPDDAVFRDIIMKAAQGNIKYQELYLKYIDLISEKLIDENEVVYEATFIDDEDQNT